MIPSQKGIGIRKGATGRLDAGQQSLPQGQVAPGNDYLSAGEFVDRPLLDRINPFTPFGSKKFIPSAHGQNLIDHYEKTTGKNVRVLPNETAATDYAQKNYGFTPGGYFTPDSMIGGGRDPFGRDIYLSRENPSLWAASHELGHAFDPEIMSTPFKKPTGNPNSNFTGGFLPREGNYSSPTTRAEAVEQWQAEPLSTYQKELVAEKAAKDYYNLAGLSDSESEGSLINYPMSYVKNLLRGVASPPPGHFDGYQGPGGPPQAAIDAYQQELLNDKDYQRAKGDLFMKAAVMADRVHNPQDYQ